MTKGPLYFEFPLICGGPFIIISMLSLLYTYASKHLSIVFPQNQSFSNHLIITFPRLRLFFEGVTWHDFAISAKMEIFIFACDQVL